MSAPAAEPRSLRRSGVSRGGWRAPREAVQQPIARLRSPSLIRTRINTDAVAGARVRSTSDALTNPLTVLARRGAGAANSVHAGERRKTHPRTGDALSAAAAGRDSERDDDTHDKHTAACSADRMRQRHRASSDQTTNRRRQPLADELSAQNIVLFTVGRAFHGGWAVHDTAVQRRGTRRASRGDRQQLPDYFPRGRRADGSASCHRTRFFRREATSRVGG